MGEVPHAFHFLDRSGFCRDPPVFGHGFGDGRIQTPVQNVEFFGRDGHLPLDRQIRDGLAHVAVVMDDLRQCEPQRQQVAPVPGRGRGDSRFRIRRRGRFQPERLRQLGEKERKAARVLDRRRRGPRPGVHPLEGPRDDLIAMGGDELVQHDVSVPSTTWLDRPSRQCCEV